MSMAEFLARNATAVSAEMPLEGAVSPQEATEPPKPAGDLPTVFREGWSLPVDHLSASSLGMWARCPEQWRRRYILGEKESPGAALVIGSGFHFAQETNFRQKIDSYRDLPAEEISEAFHHGWEREIEKYGGVGEVRWDDREKPDTLRAKGEKLSVAYRTAVSPTMQPEEVERGFLMPVAGVPVPLKGFIDFIGTKGNIFDPDDGLQKLVVDYKTSSKTVRELKPEWGLQARIYQMESKRRVEYHVAVKTADPKIITPVDAPGLGLDLSETAARTVASQLRRFTAQMDWYYREFGPDEPWPSGAPFYGWACGYCGFRPSCEWQRSV